MRHVLLHIFLLFLPACCGAQKPHTLRFRALWGGEPLLLQQPCLIPGDTVTISRLRFYVSDVAVLRKGRVVYRLPERYHLIDLEGCDSITMPASLRGDALRFNLGLDSATNAAGAQGGVLDAVEGMYWAWQSGFIHFKLEGSSRRSPDRKQQFQYHLGGFRAPFSSVRRMTLNFKRRLPSELLLDVKALLRRIDVKSQPAIMSPGGRAVELVNIVAQQMRIR